MLKSKGSKLAVVAMTALAGCTGQVESVGGVAVTQADSAGITIITIAGDPTSLPEGRLTEVPLTVIRGDAAPFLTDVGEVQFRGDGTLLVEDNRSAELRVFDRNGEMVRLVGARGEGPGEFRNLTDLSVDAGGTAYAYDRRLSRISAFPKELAVLGVLRREIETGVGGLRNVAKTRNITSDRTSISRPDQAS